MSTSLDQALQGATTFISKTVDNESPPQKPQDGPATLELPSLNVRAASSELLASNPVVPSDILAIKEQVLNNGNMNSPELRPRAGNVSELRPRTANVPELRPHTANPPRPTSVESVKDLPQRISQEAMATETIVAPVPQPAPQSTNYDPLNFPRILSILTSEYSQFLIERHQLILERLCNHYSSHSPFGAMRPLCEVLLACQDLVLNGEEEIRDGLVQFLHVICSAFDKSEAYDSCNLEETKLLLNTLGDMLDPNVPALIHAILDLVFTKMEVGKKNEDLIQDFTVEQVIPTKVRQLKQINQNSEQAALFFKLNEQSSFMMAVVEVLPEVDDLDQQVNLLVFLSRISERTACAKKLAEKGAIDCLCAYLSGSRIERAISNGIDTLWNILYEGGLTRASNDISIGEMNFHHLLILWQRLISKARTTYEKQLRNDLTCILTIAIREDPEMAKFFHRLQGTQLVQRVFRDCGGLNPRNFRGDITSIREDSEFLKFLLSIMQTVSQDEEAMQVLLNDGILETFSQYLNVPAEAAAFKIWNHGLIFTFQSQIIELWLTWLPYVSDLSRNVGVASTLMKLLSHTLEERKHVSYQFQNSWNNVSQSILRMVLVLSEISSDHKDDFGGVLIQPVIFRFVESPSLKAEVLSAALLACASLSQSHKDNRQLFGTYNGAKSILPHIKFQSPDQEETDKVVIAAADCIWEAVAGNRANEDTFLEQNGVFFILEALEQSKSMRIQKHLLGCLLDLLENPKTRAHILEWRSDSNSSCTVASTLISLWKMEEKSLGVESNGQYGMVKVDTNPLAGKNRTARHPRDTLVESQAVQELSENLRAKIFSIFYKLGFDVFDPFLSTQEMVKLKLIQKYLDFKIGEVWVEMQRELEYECVRPTTPDAQIMRVSQEMCLKKAQDVEARQLDIAKRQQQREEEEERKLYALFIDSHRKYEYREPKRDQRKLRISTAFEDGTQVIRIVEN